MRDDYSKFQERETEVLAIAPAGLEQTRQYCTQHRLPFPCLADPSRAVFKLYDVQSRLWSLGQRPGLYIVDREGLVRHVYLGAQQWEIPSNQWVLDRLDEIAGRTQVEREG